MDRQADESWTLSIAVQFSRPKGLDFQMTFDFNCKSLMFQESIERLDEIQLSRHLFYIRRLLEILDRKSTWPRRVGRKKLTAFHYTRPASFVFVVSRKQKWSACSPMPEAAAASSLSLVCSLFVLLWEDLRPSGLSVKRQSEEAWVFESFFSTSDANRNKKTCFPSPVGTETTSSLYVPCIFHLD